MAAAVANGAVANGGAAEKKSTLRNKKRKEKKKAAKQQRIAEKASKPAEAPKAAKADEKKAEDVEVEYVPAAVDLTEIVDGDDVPDEIKEQFSGILEKFQDMGGGPDSDEEGEGEGGKKEGEGGEKKDKEVGSGSDDSDDDEDGDEKEGEGKLSKKKAKLLRRMKVAELKQHCARPDVVEVWDTTASDPRLLVFLKSCRNSVPVPQHWSQKRKFLQGKRGIEKPPFQLPDFIAATGIEKIRQSYSEKEDEKKLKNKTRERITGKTGKLDIDYQVLHDAFFRFQTKPKLTSPGELYYEGKEFEIELKDKRPGVLSQELRLALGMPDNAPPPWLINMQRYGPPPSYPHLKIPGLNAAIPEGCNFGYHPGGWGKPPVDELGNPLYGDVFGTQRDDYNPYEEDVDKKKRWGDLEEEEESEEEESEEEEEEGEEGEEGDAEAASLADDDIASGIASMTSTLPSGVETPDVIDLRKKGDAAAADAGPKQLFTVLEQKSTTALDATLLGSDHTYVVPGSAGGAGGAGTAAAAGGAGGAGAAAAAAGAGKKAVPDVLKGIVQGDVQVTIAPEELEGLDEAAIKELYERRLQEHKEEHAKEDFSDMVAAHARGQKRKAAAKDKEKSKKYKDFKF